MPVVDITEDDKHYIIKAELPEVKKEDVKVTVEDGVLTLTGERKFEKEEKCRRYHRVERAYGSFTRSFRLPANGEQIKFMPPTKTVRSPSPSGKPVTPSPTSRKSK